jgi:hypothetical protein
MDDCADDRRAARNLGFLSAVRTERARRWKYIAQASAEVRSRFERFVSRHRASHAAFGKIDWARVMSVLMETGYGGPVGIEVEDDTFGKTLDGRKRAFRVARNVLAPFIP